MVVHKIKSDAADRIVYYVKGRPTNRLLRRMGRLRKNRKTHQERSSGKQTSSDPPRQRYRRSSGPPKEPDLGPLFVSSSSIHSHSTLLLPQFSAGSSPSQAPHHRHARKIKTLNLACQGPVDPSRRILQAFPCSAQGTWSDGDQRQQHQRRSMQCIVDALNQGPQLRERNESPMYVCLSIEQSCRHRYRIQNTIGGFELLRGRCQDSRGPSCETRSRDSGVVGAGV